MPPDPVAILKVAWPELEALGVEHLDVFGSVGEVVNPDGQFNRTGPDGPNFEEGVEVTSGAFFVNGERIGGADAVKAWLATRA